MRAARAILIRLTNSSRRCRVSSSEQCSSVSRIRAYNHLERGWEMKNIRLPTNDAGQGGTDDMPCSFSASIIALISFSRASAVRSLSCTGRAVDQAWNSRSSSMSIVLSSMRAVSIRLRRRTRIHSLSWNSVSRFDSPSNGSIITAR